MTKDGTATSGAIEIRLTQDSTTAYFGGEAKQLDVPATVINDRFLVPVRFVAEALEATVTWDPFANVVDISADSTGGGLSLGGGRSKLYILS